MTGTQTLGCVLTLMIATQRVTAEAATNIAVWPIRTAIGYEAARLAETPRAVVRARQAEQPTDGDWSRVRALEPGTVVVVTRDRSPVGKEYLLSADESSVVVLNLTDPTLPSRAASVLREVALAHPIYLQNVREHRASYRYGNVRLEDGALFVANRLVVNLAEIIARIERPRVAELGVWLPNHPFRKGMGLGIAIGSGAGLLIGRSHERDGGDDPGPATIAGLEGGLLLGAAGGLVLGFINASTQHGTTHVIYRAPEHH